MPGPWEPTLILATILLLFGAVRIPAIGEAPGRSIANIRKSLRPSPAKKNPQTMTNIPRKNLAT
jgi:Sec-independent protein translocase protein TatA